MQLLVDKIIFQLVHHSKFQKIQKPWGIEWMISTNKFIIKIISVMNNCKTSLQFHKYKSEIILPLEGTGHVFVHPKYKINPGQHVLINPNDIHRVIGPLLLLEVTTLDNDDVIRLEDDYGRKE